MPQVIRMAMLTSVALVALATGSASAGSAPRTPAQVGPCLTKHKLLGAQSSARAIPGENQVAVFFFSFALIPAAAQNNGRIVLERTAADAEQIGAQCLQTELKRLRSGGLKVTVAMILTTYSVDNNAVILWNNDAGVTPPGRKLAKRTLAACLG